MDKELRNLVRLLRRKASMEYKKVTHDVSHYEGMCKGMYLGYSDAASRLDEIIKAHWSQDEPRGPSSPDKEW